MSLISLEKLIGYIVSRLGCVHPYRVSRILMLISWRFKEVYNKDLVCFTVEGFEAGYYIPEVSNVIKEGVKKDSCYKRDEERRCAYYTCGSIDIEDASIKNIVDSVIEQIKDLGDIDLNRLVIKDPRYNEVLKRKTVCT